MIYCVIYMKRTALVYLQPVKLRVIDEFAKERNMSRSELMVNATMGFINSSKYKVRCAFCSSGSIGKYLVTLYDPEKGEVKKESSLCEKHLAQAKSEGTVSEV